MSKEKVYSKIIKEVENLVKEEVDMIANLANTAAVLYNNLEEVNWTGFYLWKDDQLVLGPFQGKPACIRIDKGKGVCGTAVEKNQTIVVPDVHQFPGHIACDPASQSEIVVPINDRNRLRGVLDIDSPVKNRFNEEDQEFLEEMVEVLVKNTEWNNSDSII